MLPQLHAFLISVIQDKSEDLRLGYRSKWGKVFMLLEQENTRERTLKKQYKIQKCESVIRLRFAFERTLTLTFDSPNHIAQHTLYNYYQ